MTRGPWRILEPEDLVLEVAGLLLTAAAERPGQKVWLQQELERRGILATNVDVHQAVAKLRRRYSWRVAAVEGEPGWRGLMGQGVARQARHGAAGRGKARQGMAGTAKRSDPNQEAQEG